MEDDQEANDQKAPEVEDTFAPLQVTAETNPLTSELISAHISLIGRTADGLSHSYIRLELHQKDITNLNHLEKFPHLRYIDLSENQIINIDAIQYLHYVLSLNLAKNYISELPTSMDKKQYLQHLNLSNNRFVDWTLPSLPHLTFLNLNNNKLTETMSLKDYPELLHLEMRANKLKSIPQDLNCPKLTKLYLAGNQLKELKFKPFAQLTVLHLRSNQLSSLAGIEKLPALTYLNLRQNLIDKADLLAPLEACPKLRILVLSENPIEEVENYRLLVIGKFDKLTKLDKESVSSDEREEALAFIASLPPPS